MVWETICLAALLAASAAVFWRGGDLERRGLVVIAAALVCAACAETIDPARAAVAFLPLGVLLIWLIDLAWKAPRPWPAVAAGFAAIMICGLALNLRRGETALGTQALAALGVLACLIWGTRRAGASKRRRKP